MKLLVINQYASTPEYSTGAGERHYFLGRELAKHGIEVTVVSSAYNHLFEKNPKVPFPYLYKRQNYEGVEFIWVRGFKYNPKSGLGRLLSWIYFTALLFLIRFGKRFDVTLLSSMSIIPWVFNYWFKWRYKVPYILEIRDIWPLTLVELGKISTRHPVVRWLAFNERKAYKNAEEIVSVLKDFEVYFKENFEFKKNIHWIPNAISESLKLKLAIKYERDDFVVGYAGAIGKANRMKNFVASAILLSNLEKVRFRIVGDGPELEELKELARENESTNIEFFPKVSKEEVQSYINDFDICYHGCAKQDIYRFGISPNKLNDYMLQEKPVISASGLRVDPVNLAGCGMVVEADDEQAIADAITILFKMTREERDALGRKGKDFIIKNQTYSVIGAKYLGILNQYKK